MKKKLKDYIILGIVAALIILIIIIAGIMPGKEKSFEIKDRCGPIMNMISHTIPNKDVCKTRCSSQCETMELSFSRISFQEAMAGCHSCTCFCKKTLFG